MNMRAIAAEVLPFRLNQRLLNVIRTRIAVLERKSDDRLTLDPTWETFRCLEEMDLRDSLRAELARREQVQRRAQTLLSSIAVMTAFTIGAVGAMRASNAVMPAWILGIATFSTFPYFAAAAWFALATVRPGDLYDFFLQSRVHAGQPLSSEARKDRLVWLVQVNQAQNLILGVLADRTYRCVRNGLACLVALLLLLLVDGALIRLGMPVK
jgi:hypothetical protein